MNSPAHNHHAFVSYLLLSMLITATIGCTTSTTVPDSTPTIYIQQKLPFHVAFMPTEQLDKRICSYSTPIQEKYEFDCGNALYKASIKTMNKLFMKVDVVTDRREVSQGTDRVVILDVDEFKILYSHWSSDQAVRLTLNYRISDKDNNIRFSSVIKIEEHSEYARHESGSMLASNNHSSSATHKVMEEAVISAWAAGSGPSFDKMITRVIEKALVRMSEEITNANRSGKL